MDRLPLVPAIGALLAFVLAGCAFDISYVRQQSASFTPLAGAPKEFTLDREITAPLGTGFPTRLNPFTRWKQVGSIEYGDVYVTKDQIVTVVASNSYEAQLVLANDAIAGFYLIVEKTFAPVNTPIPLVLPSKSGPPGEKK